MLTPTVLPPWVISRNPIIVITKWKEYLYQTNLLNVVKMITTDSHYNKFADFNDRLCDLKFTGRQM